MRIGVIGGLDRAARDLESVALHHGHLLETHTGVVNGAASSAGLRALVDRSDVVLLLTDVNSHNAVRVARRQARLRNRPLRIMRRLGTTQLAALLRELAAPSGRAPGIAAAHG